VKSAFAFLLGLGLAVTAVAEEPSGEDIVNRCYYKYAGEDQRSRLLIVLADTGGKRSTSEYRRLWKNYHGRNGAVEKVMLFTESPAEMRGVNFMRWAYTTSSGKSTDQWVYLPETHMVRRVSQRDPNNMDWGYTDEDLRIRALDEDMHRFDKITQRDGEEFYVVESIPRGNSAYSKRVTHFNKTADWEACTPRQVDYYAKNGELLKQEVITWQKIEDAWVWETAVMHNVQTGVSATYQMLETEVNISLPDAVFSERQLRRGYPEP